MKKGSSEFDELSEKLGSFMTYIIKCITDGGLFVTPNGLCNGYNLMEGFYHFIVEDWRRQEKVFTGDYTVTQEFLDDIWPQLNGPPKVEVEDTGSIFKNPSPVLSTTTYTTVSLDQALGTPGTIYRFGV
jgi:hypothetical protein